jgi:hypothetical protein
MVGILARGVEILLPTACAIDALPEHLFNQMLFARLAAGVRNKMGTGVGCSLFRVRLLQQ